MKKFLAGLLACSAITAVRAATPPPVIYPISIANGGTSVMTPPITAFADIGFGDSLMYGQGPGNILLSWSYLAATDWNLPYTDYGITGEQACDMDMNEVFKYLNPTRAFAELIPMMIGTNDAYFKGAGGGTPANDLPLYLPNVYTPCHQAALSWAAVPLESKVMGQAATVTGTWTNATTPATGIGISSTVSGSTASFPITVQANQNTGATGPIYIWYNLADTSTGTFTYQLDGATSTSVNSFTSPAIATNNGGTTGMGLIRIPNVTAGNHTILITVTSSGQAVGIWAVGTAPQLPYTATQTILSGGVPYEQNDQNSAITASYNTQAQADVTLLQGDGLNIRFANVRAYVNSTTDMTDIFHPNATGSLHYRDAFEAAGYVPKFMPVFQLGSSPNIANYITADPQGQLPTSSTLTGGFCVYCVAGNDYGMDFKAGHSGYMTSIFAGPNGAIDFGVETNPKTAGTFTEWGVMKSTNFYWGPSNQITLTAAGMITSVTNVGTLSYLTTPTTVSTGATPALVASNGLQTITLSANATPTISGIASGQRVTFQICQPPTGGPYTWTWPASVHSGMTIGTTAGDCSEQSFDSFNGTTLVPESQGVINVAP